MGTIVDTSKPLLATFLVIKMHQAMCIGLMICSAATLVVLGDEEMECWEPEDEFKCNSGLCIPLEYRCDGHPDCKNGEDETEQNCKDWCYIGYEKCADGQGCYDPDWLCDDRQDCADGSDEDRNMCDEMYPNKKK